MYTFPCGAKINMHWTKKQCFGAEHVFGDWVLPTTVRTIRML